MLTSKCALAPLSAGHLGEVGVRCCSCSPSPRTLVNSGQGGSNLPDPGLDLEGEQSSGSPLHSWVPLRGSLPHLLCRGTVPGRREKRGSPGQFPRADLLLIHCSDSYSPQILEHRVSVTAFPAKFWAWRRGRASKCLWDLGMDRPC